MSWIVNPSSDLHLVVHCRVQGRGPIEVSLPISSRLELGRRLFELLATGAGEPVPPDLPSEIVDEFVAAGVFVAPEEAVPPLPRFSCTLGGALPELLPQAIERERNAEREGRDLELAAEIWLERADDPVDASRGSLALSDERPVLWVRDPGTRIWMPFSLGEPVRSALLALLAGERRAEGLPADQAHLLSLAGVLGARGFSEARGRAWRATLDQARKQLESDQYAVVRGVLNPLQLAEIRRYLRELHRAEAFTRGDDHVELRDWIHNERLAQFLHHELLWTVNQVIGRAASPSYAYLAVYRPGAVLNRHTDRPQCEWNVSLVLDSDPETDRDSAWPIYLETNGTPHEVRLAMGDFVLYRGTEVPHWRHAQPAGRRCTVCFFHFVSTGFSGSLD